MPVRLSTTTVVGRERRQGTRPVAGSAASLHNLPIVQPATQQTAVLRREPLVGTECLMERAKPERFGKQSQVSGEHNRLLVVFFRRCSNQTF
jgi:hypothetical protein